MYDRSIDKEKSILIKAIAILLMILHHLFAFPNRIENVEYISVFFINNKPFEYYLGGFSKICVSMFLFVSGYGIYITDCKKRITYKSILKRILNFYINYWLIFILFVPMGIIIDKINPTMSELLINFSGISSSINREWWFVKIYIILILMYPIINVLIIKYKISIVFIGTIVAFRISYLCSKLSLIIQSSVISIFLSMVALILYEQIYFIIGILVARYKIFDRISENLKSFKINIKEISLLLLIFLGIIYILTRDINIINDYIYVFIMPIFIYVIINIIKCNSILNYIGSNSNNIWLTHSFFCYYYFQQIIFIPKYSILIFLWLIILSLMSSMAINFLLNIIKYKSWFNFSDKH